MEHRPSHFSFLVQQTPVGGTHISCFSAYPAEVASVATVVPDDRIRLQLSYHAERLGPLVIGLAVDAPGLVGTAIPTVATIGAIEPHLEDVAVVRQQFTQLVAEISHILSTTVFRMVTVPGRQIDGELQTFLTAGVGQLTYHIAHAVFPRSVLNRVICICRRPHAETAVMLGGEDDALHARLLAHTRPLAAVEAGGIE